jgi:hypothetical protein
MVKHAISNRRALVMSAVLVLLSGRALSGATYQVSLNGSDSNNGIAKPWKSLQKGVDALKPGDTLKVLAGEYAIDAAIAVKGKKATQEAPILIQAQGKVVLRDGKEKINTWQGILDIRDSTWITVRGFTLEQSGFFGVYMNAADHITVEGCATNESIASGVAAWVSSNITIRDNDIKAACNQGESIRGTSCQEHISLDHVQGFLVEGNKVHDSPQSGKAHWGGGEGIDVKNGTSNGIVRNNEVWNLVELGLYVDAWRADITNVEVYGNRVHHCANGIAVNSEQTGNLSNLRIHDNLSYANGRSGIALWFFRNTTVTGIQFYNNTVVGNGLAVNQPYFLAAAEKADKGIGIDIRNPHTTGLVIRDNISYNNVSAQLAVAPEIPGPVIAHNMIGPALGTGISGDHALTGDPMFVDLAGWDLRLKPGSPAIDAGLGGPNLGVTDAWGNPRVIGNSVDVGAFEADAAQRPNSRK